MPFLVALDWTCKRLWLSCRSIAWRLDCRRTSFLESPKELQSRIFVAKLEGCKLQKLEAAIKTDFWCGLNTPCKPTLGERTEGSIVVARLSKLFRGRRIWRLRPFAHPRFCFIFRLDCKRVLGFPDKLEGLSQDCYVHWYKQKTKHSVEADCWVVWFDNFMSSLFVFKTNLFTRDYSKSFRPTHHELDECVYPKNHYLFLRCSTDQKPRLIW